MIKKAMLGTLAVATVGTFVFGRDAVSYFRTGVRTVREAVKSEVPIDMELERARDEVANLLPEIRKSLHVVAEQQVEVEHLNEAITRRTEDLADQEEAILALNEDLKTGENKFVYAGHSYTAGEVQRDLAERFNRFRVAEETLKQDKAMLVAKEKALTAHRETLEGMLSQKKTLEVELERLNARMRTIEARKQICSLEIDDSKLARAKALIAEIDKKLDIEAKLLDSEGNFAGLIPVETKTEAPENIALQVDSYFSERDGKPTDAVDAKVASLNAEE